MNENIEINQTISNYFELLTVHSNLYMYSHDFINLRIIANHQLETIYFNHIYKDFLLNYSFYSIQSLSIYQSLIHVLQIQVKFLLSYH